MRITKYNSMNDVCAYPDMENSVPRVLLRISAGYVSKRSVCILPLARMEQDRKDSVGRAVFDHSRSVDRCSESDSGICGKMGRAEQSLCGMNQKTGPFRKRIEKEKRNPSFCWRRITSQKKSEKRDVLRSLSAREADIVKSASAEKERRS